MSKVWVGKGTSVGGIWLGRSWTSSVRFPSEALVTTDMAWRERIRLESRLGTLYTYQSMTQDSLLPVPQADGTSLQDPSTR
jgi:hypothetical protein